MNVLYLIILILEASEISKHYIKTMSAEIMLKISDVNKSDVCCHQHDLQTDDS